MGSLCQGYKYVFAAIYYSSYSKPHERVEREEDICYPYSLWAALTAAEWLSCTLCAIAEIKGQLHL